MAAREHSRFVHFGLPWLIAAAGLVVYLLTLHTWVSFESVGLVAKVTGWDWSKVHFGAVTLLLTWPIRWLPEPIQLTALNALSAVLAGLTLGILAKSVALLPHDRTRDQRQRERSDFSFLTVALAWVPPLASAVLLGFQLTFWEHATAQTGEMVNLALFALCIYSFLRFRVLQEDRYLAYLAFLFGAAAANDWGVISFCPFFFVAILWAKGIAFFDANFLIRTTLAGLAGTLLYLIPPIVLKTTGEADNSILELLHASLGIQRQMIVGFPRWTLLFCSLASIIPVIFMGIRWPSTFGDMSAAGAAMTNFFFRVIHAAFWGVCAWVMFDPPFSPRIRGFGLPFLHFYFLSALAAGYAAGYLILIFGREPERKMKRGSEGMAALGRMVSVLVAVLSIAAGAGLAYRNFPTIRGHNGSLTRDLARTLMPPSGASDFVLLSDDQSLLAMATGLLKEENKSASFLSLNTDLLRRHVYQKHFERTQGPKWPALAVERLTDPLGDDIVLQQLTVLARNHPVFYLHPSFGYYFEMFHLMPTNTIYGLAWQTTNTFQPPPLNPAEFESIHKLWTGLRERWVDNPALARMQEQRVADAPRVSAHFARGFNAWGVLLQRAGRADEAARFFDAASQLDKDNLAAAINRRYNEQLRAGKRDAIAMDQELNDQLGRYRDLPSFLLQCGPVDEPTFCYKLGRIFAEGSLYRQAAQQFARALDLSPGNTEARMWLASATLNCNLFDDVLRMVTDIRKQSTNLTIAQNSDLTSLESWARYRKGDLGGAERLLLEAQRQYPDRVELLQTLNDIYVASNQTNAALGVLEKLIARLPGDPRPLITKSALQIQAGSLNEAITTLTTILTKDPKFFPALVNRALAFTQLGRLDEAEKDYLKLLDLAPQMAVVYYHLGEIDYQRRNAAGAKKHYRRFLETSNPGTPEARTAQQRLDEIAAGKLGG